MSICARRVYDFLAGLSQSLPSVLLLLCRYFVAAWAPRPIGIQAQCGVARSTTANAQTSKPGSSLLLGKFYPIGGMGEFGGKTLN